MPCCQALPKPTPDRRLTRLGRLACLALMVALSGCGSRPVQHTRVEYNPSRYYPPPGPTSDPWGPYVREASGRFGIPELWIRRVMRQESGGQEDVISWAGAMGLMQVMPSTYDDLRGRYSLGDDPFDPHNNILAGAAYLREMYDRYGAPGFLAAYNAGPNRLDSYLNNGRPLPDETVNYVASIAPLLGPGTPMSGPLAVYAGQVTQLAAASTPAGCDPDAAYNPNGPCTPLQQAAVVTVAQTGAPMTVAQAVPSTPASPAPYEQSACDPDAAYDPSRPCQPAAPPATLVPAVAYASPVLPREPCDPDAAYDPARRCTPPTAAAVAVIAQPLPPPTQQQPLRPRATYAAVRPLQERLARPVAFTPGPPPGRWAIQVGAFASLTAAEAAAENARFNLPDILRMTKIELPATKPFGTQVAFRARLLGLTAAASTDACARLTVRGIPCVTVAPTRDSF
jgi:D-alanyl-D-alanine carboxypeptidase